MGGHGRAAPSLFSWGVGSSACHPSYPGARSGRFIQHSTQQWKFLQGKRGAEQLLPRPTVLGMPWSQRSQHSPDHVPGAPLLHAVLAQVAVDHQVAVGVVGRVVVGDHTAGDTQAAHNCRKQGSIGASHWSHSAMRGGNPLGHSWVW